MKFKPFLFAALMSCSSFLYGFDYEIQGSVSSFSKFGFNHQPIDLSQGLFPTESFSFINAGIGASFDFGYGFFAAIGGYVGGVVYDDTKFAKETTGDFYNHNGVIYNLFGFWSGPDARSTASSHNAKYYALTELNIGYEYGDYIKFKIGRFRLGGDLGVDWLTAYVEGIGISSKAIPMTTLWGFVINKRAFVGYQWFKDFKIINPNYPFDQNNGFYIYAGGANITYKNFNLNAYIYAQDSRFIAPGFRAQYDTFPDFDFQGFRSKTEILALFMNHLEPAFRKPTIYNNYPIGSAGIKNSYFDIASLPPNSPQTLGKGGIGLMLKQTFYIHQYDFGMMIYKNFGDTNELLGSVGDPSGLDNWDNSVYDNTTWNNTFRRDALSGFLFFDGVWGHLNYGFLARFTHSPRADEQSASITLSYNFSKHTNAGFKLEYYNNTTFRGYTLGLPPKTSVLQKTISQDRSFMQTFINYKF